MKKSLVKVATLALLGSFAFAANAEEVDFLSLVSNGAISDKDAVVLDMAQKEAVIGGAYIPNFASHAAKNFSYYNYLHQQALKAGRLTVSPKDGSIYYPKR